MNRSLTSMGVFCLFFLLTFACGPQSSSGKESPTWIKASGERLTKPGDQTLSPYFLLASEEPDVDRLPLKSSRAQVQIAGVIARVKVGQSYKNEGKNTLEAIYVFPASTRAAVYALRMTIGKRVIEAKIKERGQARDDYERARREGRTASLLEQQRPNVFQMNVANILPGDEINVELEYTELLIPEDGSYEFVYPTVVGPRYSNLAKADADPDEQWVQNPYLTENEKPSYSFELKTTIRSGIPISKIMSPSHDVRIAYSSESTARIRTRDSDMGDRDFVLRYSLAQKQIEAGLLLYPGENENFFLMMMEPPERIAQKSILPREYIFIVDVSGSMHGFPLEVTKELMRDLLTNLEPSDSFNVLLFAGKSAILSPESLWATRKNVDRALDVLDKQHGGGGTELLPALERALALPRKGESSRILVLATDGYVRVEKQAFELVSKNLGQANLFAFGIGSSVNRHLIEGLAHAGMGEPFVALNQGEARSLATRFREYIAAPLMQDIQVDFKDFDTYDLEPPALPDLFAKRPLILFGKYRGKPQGTISFSGRVPGEKLSGHIQVQDADRSADNDALRYLWARHRVRRLDDLNSFGPSEVPRQEIIELGLAYNLMTAFTSFVAVDTAVRAQGQEHGTVKQALPLPQGVGNQAVGGYGSSMGLLGNLRGGGSGGAGYGVAKLQALGSGLKTVKSKSGSVQFRRAKVTGSLDRNAIQRVIRKHFKQVKYCYERELIKNPKLTDKIVLRFTIDAQGNVSNIESVTKMTKSKDLLACLFRIIKAWCFPKPPGGGEVVITYPFIFKTNAG